MGILDDIMNSPRPLAANGESESLQKLLDMKGLVEESIRKSDLQLELLKRREQEFKRESRINVPTITVEIIDNVEDIYPRDRFKDDAEYHAQLEEARAKTPAGKKPGFVIKVEIRGGCLTKRLFLPVKDEIDAMTLPVFPKLLNESIQHVCERVINDDGQP